MIPRVSFQVLSCAMTAAVASAPPLWISDHGKPVDMFAIRRRLALAVSLSLLLFSPGFGQDYDHTRNNPPFGGVAPASASQLAGDYYQPMAADLQVQAYRSDRQLTQRPMAVATGISPASDESPVRVTASPNNTAVTEPTPSFRISPAPPPPPTRPSFASIAASAKWPADFATRQSPAPCSQSPQAVLGSQIITAPSGGTPSPGGPLPAAFPSGPPAAQLPAWLPPATAWPQLSVTPQTQNPAVGTNRSDQVSPPFVPRVAFAPKIRRRRPAVGPPTSNQPLSMPRAA